MLSNLQNRNLFKNNAEQKHFYNAERIHRSQNLFTTLLIFTYSRD